MTNAEERNIHENFPNWERLLSDRRVWEAVIDREVQVFLSSGSEEPGVPSPEERRRFEQILQMQIGAEKLKSPAAAEI